MQCRLCGSQDLIEVMHLPGVPRDIQHLLESPHSTSDQPTDLTVHQCRGCDLVQVLTQLATDYYDDYVMTQSFSPKLHQYLDQLVSAVLAQHNIQPSRVLDVGCGDGAFMYPFRSRGIYCVGIEPSAAFRSLAQAQGFQVRDGYMRRDTRLPDEPYDLFVTRQVLEHVHDISGFFQGIRNSVTQDAWGIVEVPRLEKAQQDLRFYDFFPDHVNYFSLPTLARCCELHGFDVMDMRSGMDEEYNIAVIRRRPSHQFRKLQQHRLDLVAEIENLFHQHTGHCVIWGAGAKGLSILAAMDCNRVDFVVDSDPNKIGKWTPVSKLPIKSPDVLTAHPVGVVVITAVAYQDIIEQKLRGMDYQGQIFRIAAQGLVKV